MGMPGRVMLSGAWVPMTRARDVFNHPGHSDQKSHGRKGGGMSGEEFDARLATAAQGEDVERMTRVDPGDPDVRSAIRDYGGGGSYAANSALRETGGDLGKVEDWYAREVTEGMDKALADSRLSGDGVVVRGIADPLVTFGREPGVGMEWVDHGFVSTSAKPFASDMFTGVKYGVTGGLQMRILAPRGTPAMSDSARLVYDAEVVLGRGLRYRMVRDNGVDFDGVRQFDVEVLL